MLCGLSVLLKFRVSGVMIRQLVGWVERSETHRSFQIWSKGFRLRLNYPTISIIIPQSR